MCHGYKAPEKVDDRLFTMKDIFLEEEEKMDNTENQNKKPLVFLKQGKKDIRNRGGYESGISTTLKKGSVVEFINSKDPVSVLGTYTKLIFEDENEELVKFIKEHELTTDEICYKCEDLLVLGKIDFKLLLKW